MLVKLWDTKTGKVLFTLDSHGGKEEFILFGVQPNFLKSYLFIQSNSALGQYRLEISHNKIITVYVMYTVFI